MTHDPSETNDPTPDLDTIKQSTQSQSGTTGAPSTPAEAAPQKLNLPLLWRWVRKALGWVALRGLVIVVAILVYAWWQGQLAPLESKLGRAWLAGQLAFSEEKLPGLLSIEPPQLYTRERLVNDRFRQANWLEDQLDDTNDHSVATISSRRALEQKIDMLFNSNTSTDGSGKATPAPSSEVQPSDLQSLTEVDKTRLRLRTDLMDTLLDDGHDLDGNTLYRLNFDAVVMPFIAHRGPPGTAIFIITARDAYSKLDCYDDEPSVSCITTLEKERIEQERVADDVELLRGWQGEIQQFLTRVLEARIQDFRAQGRLNNPVDPKEDIALDWFLRRELYTSFLDAIIYDPDVLSICAAKNHLVLVTATDGSKSVDTSDMAWADACKNWIAQSLGLEWTTHDKVPTLKRGSHMGPMVEAGFRKAITRAHFVNSVHSIEGQKAMSALSGQGVPPRETDQTEDTPTKDYASLGRRLLPCGGSTGDTCQTETVMPKGAAPPVSIQRMLTDTEHKRAVVRLITVWREMGVWGRSAFAGARSLIKDPSGEIPPEALLLSALNKYDTLLPGKEHIDALEQALQSEAQENFILVRDSPMPRPRLLGTIERCEILAGVQTPLPDMSLDYIRENLQKMYTCLFLHSDAAFQSRELISHFLLDRLEENLDVYDRENRSIRDFLNITLQGCGTTGCSIQVAQHLALPGTEVYGARAAGLSVPTQNPIFRTFLPALESNIDKVRNIVDRQSGADKCFDPIQLDNDGLAATESKVRYILAPEDADARNETVEQCTTLPVSVPTRKRLETTLKCLDLAKAHADLPEGRAEIYLACMLRNWIDSQRSNVTVYGVSPRAGDGNDLSYGAYQSEARISGQAPSSALGTSRFGFFGKRRDEQVISNPRIIGLSHVPGSDRNIRRDNTNMAMFGWAIRPRKLISSGTYQSSHHRLSAVISLPSWWKRVAFEVQACWVGKPPTDTDFTDLCDAQSVNSFAQEYEINLPRRVEEVTARFNFDFIRAPYFYREFDNYVQQYPEILSLEAGRKGSSSGCARPDTLRRPRPTGPATPTCCGPI